MLTDLKIKKEAALSSSYTLGCHYYRDDFVRNLKYYAETNSFEAKVIGGHRYSVYIKFNDDNEIANFECDCPAYYNYDGACKHIVAVLKAIQAKWEVYFGPNSTVGLTASSKAFLAFFNDHPTSLPREVKQARIHLEPTYYFSTTTGSKRNWLEFMIGSDRMYVMKDIKKFLEAIADETELAYGKNFIFKPQEAIFDDKSKALLEFLNTAYLDEKQLSNWGFYSAYNSAYNDARKFKLNNTNLLKFFQIIGEESFTAFINDQKNTGLKITKGRPQLQLNVQGISGGLKVGLDLAAGVYDGLDTDFKFVYHNGFIYRTDEVFASYLKPVLKCFYDSKKSEIMIPAPEVPGFFSVVVPALEKIAVVQVDTALSQKFYREQLEIQAYFDRSGDGISARIEFRYGELMINPALEMSKEEVGAEGRILLRTIAEENRVTGLFKSYGFEKSVGRFVQTDEESAYNFLKEGLPALAEMADVFYSDDFKNIRIKSSGRVSAGVRLNTGTDMLEMSLYYEDMEPAELIELLSSYKLKKRYHRMKNGAFIPLDSVEFQTAADLVEQLGITAADISKQIIELPKYHAMYVDSLAKEAKEFHLERSGAFKKMAQDIREHEDTEYEVPEGIQGKLRDYQKTGFKWLKALSQYGFGGILADDMGLGKTLQVLTFLLSEKNGENMPSLVIVPTSLVYNWEEEVRKFAPGLKIIIVSGQHGDRLGRLKELEATDLVVTSYALLKRDIDMYEKTKFKYCFIDEAQHIKNPNTLNAKTVKRIKAKGHFALTGTPVENTLTELWSIFDFLMPGYLQTHNKFQSRYETPIVRNADKKALHELGRHIKPFILRRMKKEVLKELPEKIESKLSCEMTAEQVRIYAGYLLKAKKEFEDEMLANGFEKSQIKILALLTRLRQICCSPALFIDNYRGGSGKLDTLLEILENAMEGGHRVLLFSQFTSMLALIKRELDLRAKKYHYLDGATSAENRMKLVNSFNAGEKDIFLISLKAGGTGLNLTGADMVIHYDPWWNPAVEDQATDRAYRIGQKNSVQVFKLITKDTIEEKIYELQQKKKELIDAVIKPGESFLTKMSEAEIRKLFE